MKTPEKTALKNTPKKNELPKFLLTNPDGSPISFSMDSSDESDSEASNEPQPQKSEATQSSSLKAKTLRDEPKTSHLATESVDSYISGEEDGLGAIASVESGLPNAATQQTGEPLSPPNNLDPASQSECISTDISEDADSNLSAESYVNSIIVQDDACFDYWCIASNKKMPSDFDRILLVDYLCQQYPKKGVNGLKQSIQDILNSTERSPVELSFKKKTPKKSNEMSIEEKIKEVSSKKYSPLECVKRDLNKVTLDTVEFFSTQILKTHIDTLDEMREIASFMFYKCVEEPTFLETYLKVIDMLKKNFKCEEEKKMNVDQSCFFGSILKFMIKKIEEKHTWHKTSQVERLNKSEGQFEAERENLELNRILKAKQVKGSVLLCAKMYDNLLTSATHIVKASDYLMRNNSSENVELICLFIENCSKKLYKNHPEQFLKMCSWVKKNNIYGPRIEIRVESALNEFQKLKKMVTKPAERENIFASIISEPEPEKIEANQTDKILDCMDEIIAQCKSAYDEMDLSEIADSVRAHSKSFDNLAFYEHFFITTISSTKIANKMMDMFCLFLKDDCQDIFGTLKSLKSNIGQHYGDYPSSLFKYPELVVSIRGEALISADEYKYLKTPDFMVRAGGLLSLWKSANDERISLVATPDEIEQIR